MFLPQYCLLIELRDRANSCSDSLLPSGSPLWTKARDTQGEQNINNQLCFLVTHILYLTGFSVGICIFKSRGKKAYHDRLMDIMFDIYSCTFILKKNILDFTRFSVLTYISELEALHIFKLRGQKDYHDGHIDIMVSIYRYTFMK